MREIDTEIFLEVMRINTEFDMVDTPLGTCVEMDWANAFCFAYCTSARYLTSHILPFTPGLNLLQLTNEALTFNTTGGNIFDGGSVRNSPLKWNNSPNSHMFRGTKFILPVEVSSESEISTLRRNWIRALRDIDGYEPTDFILVHIDISKKGNGMEQFLEYMVCYHFRSLGWVVDNQLTLNHSTGTPDFTAFKNDDCEEGYFLVELMLEFAGHKINCVQQNMARCIVGEAKTGTGVFEEQLMKYLRTGYFNKGYGLLPQNKQLKTDDIGLIYIDANNIFVVRDTEKTHEEGPSQYAFLAWANSLQNCYMLLNGPDEALVQFLRDIA